MTTPLELLYETRNALMAAHDLIGHRRFDAPRYASLRERLEIELFKIDEEIAKLEKANATPNKP